MDGHVRPRGAALALAAVVLLAGGCYGKFPLVRSVHGVNGLIPTDTLRAVGFWAGLPAYGGALAGDLLVMNVIEVWTGVAAPSAAQGEGGGWEVALAPYPGGREATLSLRSPAGDSVRLLLVRAPGDRVEVRDAAGRPVGAMVRTKAGGWLLTDTAGRPLAARDGRRP